MPNQLDALRRKKRVSVQRMAAAAGVSVQAVNGWLTGQTFPGQKSLQKLAALLGVPVEELHIQAPVNKLVSVLTVPVLEGPVIPAANKRVPVFSVTFAWLRERAGVPDPKVLRLVTATGHSMEPCFADGDLLLVDTGSRSRRTDGLYAFSVGTQFYVARLQHLPDGARVLFDNPAFPSFLLTEEQVKKMMVFGRIAGVL